jgi:hypothetical protein
MASLEPDALRRVRKLLALATSPNPNEAAVAAAKAQSLIEQHRLQAWIDAERDVNGSADPITDARDQPLETSKRLRKWKVSLAAAVAQPNGCVAYTLSGREGRSLVLVGRAGDRAAVTELWKWLVKRIEWLSATHGKGQPRQWHNAFRFGVVAAVATRLGEATAEARASLAARSLVVVDPARAAHQAALDRFVAENLHFGRARGVSVDAEAFAAGQAASAAIDLP